MVKVEIVKTYFDTIDGKFNLDSALLLSGQFAGICYDPEGYEHLKNEPREKSEKRVKNTKTNGHHSVYGHIYLSLNITNIPKILAMFLNNEHEYNTSEKSARYTKLSPELDDGKVVPNEYISGKEFELYNKWLDIFQRKIKELYPSEEFISDIKIKKLSQENARYMVTVFMPTTMIYTTSLRQINYIYSFCQKYIIEHNKDDDFENKVSKAMEEFCASLDELGIIDKDLIKNEKCRSFSLFGSDLKNKKEIFDEVYQTVYEATYSEVAQDQRHRTVYHNIERQDSKKYIIPDCIKDDQKLVQEWLEDIASVADVTPQGELVTVFERSLYEYFILKQKERLCSAAQLEIMQKNKELLHKYYDALLEENPELASDLEYYTHGARCTFGYDCPSPCKFKDGINLTRKI